MAKYEYRQELNGCTKTVMFFASYHDALMEQKRREWDFKKFEHLGLKDDDVLVTKITKITEWVVYKKSHSYKDYKKMMGIKD